MFMYYASSISKYIIVSMCKAIYILYKIKKNNNNNFT